MIIHFQNNVIWYTLKNIRSIDEKINKAKKDDININNKKMVIVLINYIALSVECISLSAFFSIGK